MTESEGESYLGPAADHGQGPGAATVAVISDQSVAQLQPGEAEQGNPDARRVAGEVSETRAAAPGVPPGAAQGGLEPRGGGDLLGGPQPRRGEGQPATREGRAAAPPPGAPESSGGRERVDPPLVEEPLGKEGGCSAEGAAGREREQGRRTPGPWEHSVG